MASQPPNAGDVFDMRKIRRLVELMNEHGLTEIDLRDAEVRIRLRKGQETVIASAAPAAAPVAAAPAVQPPQQQAPPKPADEEYVAYIKSIMVGTFFTSPSPDAPPFVKVGDHIGPDSTVCIIEAMKVFNEIPAGISGQIVAVLAQNGDAIEYGQPLFKVDTRH
ncbi:MAG: acetyl-CoA carboxylase, biotin carboxyl carrier protein [Planctomycetia bacterium 21-64-5]|nr:MAG: acetyl-CoA carboxylase, biotin carboxyl carrier protein [Planctomycetia bacterium 21-64-5]HQU41868.1 acetyl-CoA carboxylase biotin carboxyl carrier protein [Pirellulales bacterium]